MTSLERLKEKGRQELRKHWSFDSNQQHTHTWHSREDFISILDSLMDAGYEKGFIEGQRHAFGVDREAVRKEGEKAMLAWVKEEIAAAAEEYVLDDQAVAISMRDTLLSRITLLGLGMDKSYEHSSHIHCWDNPKNPCGIPLDKHTQCCLCSMVPYS